MVVNSWKNHALFGESHKFMSALPSVAIPHCPIIMSMYVGYRKAAHKARSTFKQQLLESSRTAAVTGRLSEVERQ